MSSFQLTLTVSSLTLESMTPSSFKERPNQAILLTLVVVGGISYSVTTPPVTYLLTAAVAGLVFGLLFWLFPIRLARRYTAPIVVLLVAQKLSQNAFAPSLDISTRLLYFLQFSAIAALFATLAASCRDRLHRAAESRKKDLSV